MPKTESGSAVLNSAIDAPYHALDATTVGERFDTANLLPNHQFQGKTAVFVDGCFWHGCPIHGTKPKNNAAFWRKKIAANQARDRLVTRTLRAMGWRVLRVWEHELTRQNERRLLARLRRAVGF